MCLQANKLQYYQLSYPQLEDWCVYGFSSVTFEASDNRVEHAFPDGHLDRVVVASALTQHNITTIMYTFILILTETW